MKIKQRQIFLYLACIGMALVILVSCQPAKEPGPPEETTRGTESGETVTDEPVSESMTDSPTDTVAETTGETQFADTEPTDTEPADTEPADTEPADTEPTTSNNEDGFSVDLSYEPVYEVMDTGRRNGLLEPLHPDAKHVFEIDYFGLEYTTEKIENPVPQPPESTDIQIGDQTFPVTYEGTYTQAWFPSVYHAYIGVDDHGARYWIRVDAETGLVIYFVYEISRDREDETKPILREDQCRATAKRFLFEDGGLSRGEYLLTDTEHLSYGYRYKFTRFVGGIETEESLQIHITDRGRIAAIRNFHFGNMDGVTAVPDYDEVEVIKSVERKMLDIYETLMEQHKIEYTIRDKWIVQLHEEGDLYLGYAIHVFIDGYQADRCDLLVRIK